MANIPGTIFQMKDGPSASAGNLFPKTVVGAVLGLDATIQAIKNYYTTQLGNYWLKTDVTYDQNTHILQVGPNNTVNLATVTDLSNYYTKTEADGKFLGINANAASATKLQTARTIWGQSFDGTANVTGALSGVTNINSIINIDSGYVGIDKTPSVALDVNGQVQGTQLLSTVTSSAPLVVESQELVTNLNADKLDNYDLADILAMDITGNAKTATNPKSELKTGQEFVFRKTNVEWDAKSGVIKKIVGRSLAWNQLIQQGNFSVPANGITISSDGSGKLTIVVDNPTGFNQISIAASNVVSGHKYYCRGWDFSTNGFEVYNSYAFPGSSSSGPWVITAQQSGTIYINVFASASLPNGTYYIYPELIDVTLLSSEIASMEGAEIAATIDALYPGYHTPNPGTLTSNDAEAVETTGVNQWDEEYRKGDYSGADGSFDQNASAFCNKNFIEILPSTTYYAKCPINGWVYYYDANKTFISSETIDNSTFTTPANARFMNFNLSGSYSAYTHDICINLSNPAINGQYFPYKKSRINLGLKNIKVVSPNVWDEEVSAEGKGLVASSGALTDDSSCFVTSYIPVNANTEYYANLTFGVGSGMEGICYYDTNKTFLSGRLVGEYNNGFTFTPPAGTAYIRASGLLAHKATGCINLSNPAFNGRYFHYGTLNLEVGVKGNGEWADYVDVVNQKYHKRAGIRVFDGTETDWNRYKYGDVYNFIYPLTDSKKQTINGINSLYSQRLSSDASLNANKQMSIDGYTYTYSGIFLRDDTYAGVSEFKAHLAQQYSNGHPLVVYYELQYEEVYDLAEPLPSVYPCDQYGTERVISPVSTTPSAPFCADIQYGAKSDDVANDLIGTRDAVQPLLDALQYDGQNHAWHLKGNLYADGFITAYSINGGAQTAVIAPYVIESSNYSTSKIWVRLNVMNEAIAKYKQGYLVQAKKAGEYITYSVTSIDESSYILYCNGGSVTVELES